MENVTIKPSQNRIVLTDRNTLSIGGVTKMISSNETQLVMNIGATRLCITGKNIHITKLDTENGELEASGNFDNIKYTEQNNIFKRIFK